MKEDILLIIPDKPDEERDILADKWAAQYGAVLRIGKFWIKPDTQGKKVALYGNDSFCLVLAQILELEMISPKDEMIAALEAGYIKRQIHLKDLAEIEALVYPIFIKPVVPKIFKAKVYDTIEEIRDATNGIKPEEKVIVSEIIDIKNEVRVFVLDRKVKDLAFYEGTGDLAAALAFAQHFLDHTESDLPKTFVMDLGYNPEKGWFIIEFNSIWGAGLNFCDPEKVLDCIKEATIN
jgi:hypothetical protein